jgi:serine/threonine protein kinase
MSRCPARDQLEGFLARRLNALDHAAIADHVRDCPDCRAACDRLVADLPPDTVMLESPPEPPPEETGRPAASDAPTARLWRHELALRTGERPVQAGSEFDIHIPPWPAARNPPTTIPGYEILGDLGRGGMGVVYKARQVRLNRLVALKMIHAGELSDPDTLARFRTEAMAVARLQHPNIVQIYEVGEADGRPFFSLEYVAGGSLAQRVAGKPQPPEAAAALIETLARAIDYAHSQGVVHRDLKPGNILLASGVASAPRGIEEANPRGADATPLAKSIPKIADFGLAKYTAAASPGRTDGPTRPGLIVGTPAYMAPEQAAATPETVGPTADVYALGAILYELLAGRPPFQGANAMDTLLQVRLLEPIAPRVWQPKAPRDLETITLKCLQKDPRRRYSSARELADELRRFLDGVPIRARATLLTERAWRWVRRHPSITAMAWVVLAAVVLGFVGGAVQWRQANEGRAAAEKARDETAAALNLAEQRLAFAEQELYLSRVARAHEHVRTGRVGTAMDLVRLCQPPAARPDHRGWEWHYLQHYCTTGRDPVAVLGDDPDAAIDAAPMDKAVSPDGRFTVTLADGVAVVWDGTTGNLVERLTAPVRLAACTFSPDGRRLAVLGIEPVVVLWDVATWRPVLTLHAPVEMEPDDAPAPPRLTFSHDGRRLVAAAWNAGVTVWDAGAATP